MPAPVEESPFLLLRQLMAQRRAAGKPVYDFNQGLVRPEPSLQRRAAIGEEEFWRTPPPHGFDELRKRIAQHMAPYCAQEISKENVLVTAGGNAAFSVVVDAMTRSGERIDLLSPHFPNHKMLLEVRGRRGETIPYDAGHGIRKGFRGKCLILSSPHNPLGCMIPAQAFSDLERSLREGQRIILDRSYLRMGLSGQAELVVDIERTIQMLSFSKTLAIGGLRIGAIIAPERDIDMLAQVQDCTYISASAPGQLLALEALRGADTLTGALRETLKEKRAELLAGLSALPWVSSVSGDAGPFLWVGYCGNAPSKEFVLELLEQTGVATTWGGSYGEEGFMRFGYGMIDRAGIATALEAMRSFRMRRA